MSTTFAGRLTGAEGRDLRLYLTIDGIADVLQEAAVDVPSTFEASTRTRRRVIQTVEHGQSEIDLHARRMVGGSLRVVLVDDFAESLADLFASRQRRTTWVTATTTSTTTTINVSSTTNLPSAGTVYIGGETITYTATTATTLTGCTRGAFGSQAQRHYGGTDMGSPVFEAPPRWVGRRVRLWGYFVDEDGTTTTSLRQKLDTFRLEEAPAYIGQGRWELRCSHLSDEVAQRKLGQGLAKLKTEGSSPALSGTNLVWTIEAQTNLFPATVAGFYPTFAAVTFDDVDGVAVLRYRSSTDVGVKTTIETDATPDLGNIDRRLTRLVPKEVQHWAILSGGPTSALALFALTSRLGNAANGAYDILPGTDRDTGLQGEQLRFGAGIASTEVDASSFTALDSATSAWSYVIDGTIGVDEFLRDLCLVTEAFWYVDADGLLAVKKLSEQRVTTTALTVDDRVVIGEPTVELLEDSIYPRARIRCGYDPLTGEHQDSVTVIDTEMADRYPERGDTLELETRALCLSETSIGRPRTSRAQLEHIVRRAMVDDGRGRLYVTLNATLAALTLDLGDVVTLGVDLPDYEGGSVNGRKARVISRRPRYDDGVVELRLQVQETLRHIAPACVIASAVGATLTLRTTGPETATSSPANMFAFNQNVDLVHVATGVVESFAVASVTAPATVVLSSAPAFAVSGGNDYLVLTTINANYAAPIGTTATADGYTPRDFAYQMPATTVPVESRWR